MAVCWGATDFVSLVKEVVRLDKDEEKYGAFKAEGGVLDGEKLDQSKLAEVSKWPTREEQIALLVGQILGPGSQLSSQMLGPGRKLAGQIKQKPKATSRTAFEFEITGGRPSRGTFALLPEHLSSNSSLLNDRIAGRGRLKLTASANDIEVSNLANSRIRSSESFYQ